MVMYKLLVTIAYHQFDCFLAHLLCKTIWWYVGYCHLFMVFLHPCKFGIIVTIYYTLPCYLVRLHVESKVPSDSA